MLQRRSVNLKHSCRKREIEKGWAEGFFTKRELDEAAVAADAKIQACPELW